MAVGDWSANPDLNTTIDSISIAENCPPGNMNDMGRRIMAAVKSWYDAAPTVSSVSAAIAAAFAANPATPSNLAPNSQWEIFSGLSYGRRIKADGTGATAALTVTAYTTGGTSSVLTISGDISAWTVGQLVKIANTGTVDADLYSYPLRIQAISGQDVTVKTHLGATVGTALVGTPAIELVNIGCSASTTTGDAADGWKKSTAMTCWREDYPANLAKGALYALGLMKSTGSEEYLRVELDAYQWRGRTISFGIGVNQKVRSGSGTWCAYIYSDGTGGTTSSSSDATTASGFQWLEKSVTVPTDATVLYVGIKLKGASADVYHCINPVIAATALIGAWNYAKPQEIIIPVVKVEPAPWINSSLTFPASATLPVAPQTPSLYAFYADMYAASGGSIARSIRIARGNIEGYNSNTPVTAGVGDHRLIGWADKESDPLRLGGGFMRQTVVPGPTVVAGGVNCAGPMVPDKSYDGLRLPMIDGAAFCFSGKASDTWSNVSIDLDEFYSSSAGAPV